MEHSLHTAEPVALARPRGAHRFEAFSPKLARRMTFYCRALVAQWVLLEADPSVIAFCERPGYIQIDRHKRLADFWVRYVDRNELVILHDRSYEVDATKPDRVLDVDTCTIRRVAPADLAAARIWIENWQRMLPCLVANRDLVPSTLPQAIARFVKEPRRLLDIEREFSTGDPVVVRTAVFGLLHNGRVGAPELRTQPLSLLTSFSALDAQS
ncbi:hypothetical protein [Paraburkholderia humisilvae]|uniref:TnsA endonuclease N-terminal domain-containing protein n=1 Tax=Paraburkholderia humisilvae TaxID=627669 RepID=A0A6J5D9G3_9BURK|nr:hypothetical protein [Paraburkholderia humisilvae]CAB3750960.1 hypothetical protein LMG29542_01378 [Paraburkholderia humisilvae]